MKKYILASIIALVFNSCSPSSNTVFNNNKYTDASFEGRNILFFPILDNSVIVTNKDDVLDDYGKDERKVEDIINDNFYKVLVEESKKYLDNVFVKEIDSNNFSYAKTKIDSNLFTFSKKIGPDSIKYSFRLPTKKILVSLNLEPDIVVIVDKITFGRTIAEIRNLEPESQNPYIRSTKDEYLGADVEFIIWDYKNDNEITYGVTHIGQHYVLNMTIHTWNALYRDIAKKIFYYSKFIWRYHTKKVSINLTSKSTRPQEEAAELIF